MGLELGNLRRAITALDSLLSRLDDSGWMAQQDARRLLHTLEAAND
jgi:hypothetical protein